MLSKEQNTQQNSNKYSRLNSGGQASKETDPEKSEQNENKFDILDAIDKADFVIGKVNEAKEEGKEYFENTQNVQIEMNEKTIEVSHPPPDDAEKQKEMNIQTE